MPNLLHYDDDPAVLRAVRRQLEPLGWTVHRLGDDLTADPDVILTDWRDCGRYVLDAFHGHKPVVVYTGGDAPKDDRIAAVVHKPATAHALDRTLRRQIVPTERQIEILRSATLLLRECGEFHQERIESARLRVFAQIDELIATATIARGGR